MTDQPRPENDDDVEAWFEDESEPLDESQATRDPAEKYADSQLRVVRETKDYQLEYLQMALEPDRNVIDVSPSYQRRLRWTNKKRSLLIESFLLNIPIPPIFLYERDYNEYEVIDGRQRLEALKAFLENGFALSGLQYWPELNGKRFRSHPAVLQKGLLRRSLPAVILLAETQKPNDDDLDVRHVLFDRLNTGGVKLNPQELRNALYPGNLNTLILELARSEIFCRVWGIPLFRSDELTHPTEALLKNALYSTMADAELVLRVFAIKDAIVQGKSGSLKAIMDRYMKRNATLPADAIEAMKADYLNTLSDLYNTFENRPFVLASGRRSRPLYDALMVALSLQPSIASQHHSDDIRARLELALSDDGEYDILVGRGNTIQAVRDRVTLAQEILQG